MRILYLAKHNSGDNNDEDAIAHALRQLGHEVSRVHEKLRHRTSDQVSILNRSADYDFCLFHKCEDMRLLTGIRCPKVFWYFDMVRSIIGDPTLQKRSETRIQWMKAVIPKCLVGFCTDGDWVNDYHGICFPHIARLSSSQYENKLLWLLQGADERMVGFGDPHKSPSHISEAKQEILFTGMVNHGQRRVRHVEHLQQRWGDQFAIMGAGGPRGRYHGRDLADILASVKIVVAPDGPNTNRYWSNRLYLTLGLGGFLLHPYCSGICELGHYFPNTELKMYKSWEECDSLIEYYLSPFHEDERKALMEAGYRATLERNTYRHRCHQLVGEVEKRL